MNTKNNRRTRLELGADKKFKILHRDKFQCQYCGAKPGSDGLEVDHLIPISAWGSNEECNLVAACVKCNRGRKAQPLFPHSMIIGEDKEGWSIIKQCGCWSIKACETSVVVSGEVKPNYEYWFDIDRSHESDWPRHIDSKEWEKPHEYYDFMECLEYARKLTRKKTYE